VIPLSRDAATTQLVTAYSPCSSGTITASGERVRFGDVATRSTTIPFGSIVTLRPAAFGRHRFKVEDRMNPSDAASLDVFQPSCSRAIDFGIRHERVTVTSR